MHLFMHSTLIKRTVLRLGQFNDFSLNFVTFRKHSAKKLSKTIWTDPCGVLIVSELDLPRVAGYSDVNWRHQAFRFKRSRLENDSSQDLGMRCITTGSTNGIFALSSD